MIEGNYLAISAGQQRKKKNTRYAKYDARINHIIENQMKIKEFLETMTLNYDFQFVNKQINN